MSRLQGIYAITDERLTPIDKMVSMVKEALESGVKIVQLRDKSMADSELYEVAKELKDLIESYDGLFIVDDRVELAKSVNAHGLHIGKDDEPIEKIRSEFKGIIGVSL